MIDRMLFQSIVVVACYGLMAVYPRLGRSGLWFAVTVPADFAGSPEGRRSLRVYRLTLALCTLPAIALALVPLTGAPRAIAFVTTLLGGQMLALYRARKVTLPYSIRPNLEREASLRPRHERLPGGPLLQAVPFLLGLLPIAWLKAGGELSARSATPLLKSVAWVELLCLVLLGIAWAILHCTRTEDERAARFRRTLLWFLLGTQVFVVLSSAITPALSLVMLLIALVVPAYAQWRWRAARPGDPVGDRTDDRHWKLGLYYFNRSDPALLVERRIGWGYTFNFANLWAWVITLGLLALAGVPFLFRASH